MKKKKKKKKIVTALNHLTYPARGQKRDFQNKIFKVLTKVLKEANPELLFEVYW